MSLPFISINVTEGSAGAISTGANRALVIGPASKAVPLGAVFSFSNINNIASTIGYGPAQEAAEIILSRAPSGYGLVDVIVTDASDSAGAGIVQKKVSGAVDIDVDFVSGVTAAYNDYDLGIEITKAGTLGVARFRYTLDGGHSWAYENKVPSDGKFTIPHTGLEITFDDNQTLGNTNYSIVTSPKMAINDITDAIDYLTANSSRSYTSILFADNRRTPNAGIFSAIDAAYHSLNEQFRIHNIGILPIGGENKPLVNIPNDKAAVAASAVVAAYGAVNQSTGNFISAVAERARITLPLPKPGYVAPSLPFAYAVAAEVHGVGGDVSKNPAEDSVSRVVSVSYDEFLEGAQYIEERIVAPRSFRGESGIFLNQGSLFADAQSSYYLIPHGRVVNVARATLYSALRPYLNSRIAVSIEGGGTIKPEEKVRIESDINSQLASALLTGINGAGGRGHVSGINFTLDGQNNLLQTGELNGVCDIVAFGYPSSINVTLSLVNEIVTDIAVL